MKKLSLLSALVLIQAPFSVIEGSQKCVTTMISAIHFRTK